MDYMANSNARKIHFQYDHIQSMGYRGMGFPGNASGKEPLCQCRLDVRVAGSILGSGRSLVGGNGNPLQYSCLENPMDRGAWRMAVHRIIQSWARLKRLRAHA